MNMDEAGSKQAPPVGSARVNNDGSRARQPNPYSSRRKRGYKNYQDQDLVSNGARALDYDDQDDFEPDLRDDLVGRHKRYMSQDGYHLVVRGGDNSDAGIKTESTPSLQETLDEARRLKATDIQCLPQSRKRAADSDNSHKTSAKRQRPWSNRRNRLCLDCGNYHSSPCYVPHCRLCDTKHHDTIPCLDARKQLHGRLAFPGPPASSPSSKKGTNKMQLSLSALRAPAPLLRSTSDSPVIKKEKYDSPGSNNKRPCPLCRECGSFHRSPCKWLACEKCPVKHHPDVACTVAEARLKRRLEEEDSKQAQRFMEEEDRKRAQNMTDIRDRLTASCLEVEEMRRAHASNLGHASVPDIAPKKITLKKGTRFCRDCGRYLNGACTWPTCRKCNSKHLAHIPCFHARRALQNRLDAFDRGFGTSQQKNPINLHKKLPHAVILPSPLKQVEQAYTDDVSSAEPVPIAAPIVQHNANFPFDGNVPWFVDSNKIIRFGFAPDPPDFTAPALMPQQQNGQAYTSLYTPAPKPMEMTIPSITQPMLESILSGNNSSTPSTLAMGAYPSAAKAFLEKNIDALLQEAESNASANRAIVVEHDDDTQKPPSYFEWRRRKGEQ